MLGIFRKKTKNDTKCTGPRCPQKLWPWAWRLPRTVAGRGWEKRSRLAMYGGDLWCPGQVRWPPEDIFQHHEGMSRKSGVSSTGDLGILNFYPKLVILECHGNSALSLAGHWSSAFWDGLEHSGAQPLPSHRVLAMSVDGQVGWKSWTLEDWHVFSIL
jgi:hypothetical protein